MCFSSFFFFPSFLLRFGHRLLRLLGTSQTLFKLLDSVFRYMTFNLSYHSPSSLGPLGIFLANQSKSDTFYRDVVLEMMYSYDLPRAATFRVGTAATQSWGPIDFTIEDKNTPK